jgi:hypothetical protein
MKKNNFDPSLDTLLTAPPLPGNFQENFPIIAKKKYMEKVKNKFRSPIKYFKQMYVETERKVGSDFPGFFAKVLPSITLIFSHITGSEKLFFFIS